MLRLVRRGKNSGVGSQLVLFVLAYFVSRDFFFSLQKAIHIVSFFFPSAVSPARDKHFSRRCRDWAGPTADRSTEKSFYLTPIASCGVLSLENSAQSRSKIRLSLSLATGVKCVFSLYLLMSESKPFGVGGLIGILAFKTAARVNLLLQCVWSVIL